MKTLSDVTIIIPVYNCEKYIKHSLESALDQGCNVIVVNDGSTDNTQKIIDWYDGFTKIEMKQNMGTAHALNRGIREAKTKWIKWLSADDVLKPNAIQTMIDMVEEIPDNDSKIFYTHYDIIDSNGIKKKTFTEPDNIKNSKAVLLDHFYGNGSSSLIHRNVFEKCGLFDETVGFQEDYEFWLRCHLIFDIPLHLLDCNILNYRVHDGQLTEKKKGYSMSKSEEIKEKILELSPHNRIYLNKIKKSPILRLRKRIGRFVYAR